MNRPKLLVAVGMLCVAGLIVGAVVGTQNNSDAPGSPGVQVQGGACTGLNNLTNLGVQQNSTTCIAAAHVLNFTSVAFGSPGCFTCTDCILNTTGCGLTTYAVVPAMRPAYFPPSPPSSFDTSPPSPDLPPITGTPIPPSPEALVPPTPDVPMSSIPGMPTPPSPEAPTPPSPEAPTPSSSEAPTPSSSEAPTPPSPEAPTPPSSEAPTPPSPGAPTPPSPGAPTPPSPGAPVPPSPAPPTPMCIGGSASSYHLSNGGFEMGWQPTSLLVGAETAFGKTTEYLNSTFLPGWQTNATDYFNASLLDALNITDGKFILPARLGLPTDIGLFENVSLSNYIFDFYSIVELWNGETSGITSDTGTYYLELNSDQPSLIYQDIFTIPGTTLVWSVAHRGRQNLDTATVLLGAPGNLTLVQTMVDGPDTWGDYSGVYTVPVGQTITRISLDSVLALSDTFGNFVDSVMLAPTPPVACAPVFEACSDTNTTIDILGAVAGIGLQIVSAPTASYTAAYTGYNSSFAFFFSEKSMVADLEFKVMDAYGAGALVNAKIEVVDCV